MRKTENSRRPHKSGSNGQRRGNSQARRSTRSPQNGQNKQHSSSRRGNAEAVQAWMNSPPQTLTHHISYNRKKPQDPASKKAEGPNGYRKNGGGNKGKNRQKFDRFRQEPNGKHHANRNRQEPASNRPRPETTANGKGGSGSSGDKLVANLDRFQLFTAYHLGIGPQKEYKPSNINEVAKRFNIDQATIKQALQEYGMDSASLLERDFDMALAQLDIQVAPEGIDRLELAKSLYEEFLEAPRIKRDWKKMLEDDRKENTKIFGRQ